MYLFKKIGVNEVMQEQERRNRVYYSYAGIEAILEYLEAISPDNIEFDLVAWNGTFTEYTDFCELAHDQGFKDFIDFEGIENGKDLEDLLMFSKNGIEYTLYEVERELENEWTILTTNSGTLIVVE